MRKEARGVKYGRNYSILIKYLIENTQFSKRDEYLCDFLNELGNYSFEGRKKGSPRNGGSIYELEGIEEINMENPKEFAKFVKEGIHLMYQKQTAKRVLDSLIDNLCL